MGKAITYVWCSVLPSLPPSSSYSLSRCSKKKTKKKQSGFFCVSNRYRHYHCMTSENGGRLTWEVQFKSWIQPKWVARYRPRNNCCNRQSSGDWRFFVVEPSTTEKIYWTWPQMVLWQQKIAIFSVRRFPALKSACWSAPSMSTVPAGFSPHVGPFHRCSLYLRDFWDLTGSVRPFIEWTEVLHSLVPVNRVVMSVRGSSLCILCMFTYYQEP